MGGIGQGGETVQGIVYCGDWAGSRRRSRREGCLPSASGLPRVQHEDKTRKQIESS